MYVTHTKTMLIEALKTAFDNEFPDSDFRNINIGMEYPVKAQGYPAVWVDYDDTDVLKRAGVDHLEQDLISPGSYSEQYSRWRFQGQVTFTVVALSSLERDRLYDWLIAMIAFGPEDPAMHQFREAIETNEFIAANMNFDTIQTRPSAAAPGTPWNTDELIYERTLGLDILGEFLLDRERGALANLSAIEVVAVEDYTIEDPGYVSAPPPTGGGGEWV